MIVNGLPFTSTIITKSESGNVVNADFLPIVQVYRNGVLTSIIPSVALLNVGVYTYNFTVPETWDHGDVIDIHVTANIESMVIIDKTKHTVSDLKDLTQLAADHARAANLQTKKDNC